MAERSSLWISHAGGVLTVDDTRIGLGALWTPGNSNVNARKGLRPGGTTAAASPGLVAQQTVADKTVKVNSFQGTLPASRGTGSYVATLDAVKNLDLLTANPAHATLVRWDLIIAQQNDESFSDANNLFTVKQIVGTPSASPSDPAVTGSPDYFLLARVRVAAATTTITTAMIDDLRPPWAVALGGVLPIANATDRATLTPYEGMTIWRVDRGWLETYSVVLTGWIVQGPAVCSSLTDANTIITTPYTGQVVIIGAWHYYWDGTAFVLRPGQLLGGQVRTTNAGAVNATEAVILTTPSLNLDRNSTYELSYYAVGAVTAIGDDFDMRIRATNLAGGILSEVVMPRTQNAFPYAEVIYGRYETTVAETGKVWVGTIQRITGTGTFTASPGSYLKVTKVSPSGTLSTV